MGSYLWCKPNQTNTTTGIHSTKRSLALGPNLPPYLRPRSLSHHSPLFFLSGGGGADQDELEFRHCPNDCSSKSNK